jgi:hypothetical protein
MKKLILAVLVIATFGASAAQLTKEQQARVVIILIFSFYFLRFILMFCF